MISAAVLTQLIHKLRNANARYTHIALIYRSTLRRTYHAKRRAYWTGLHINTLKAQNCPNSHVSLQPLPVIDSDPATSELELGKPAFPVPSMSKSSTTSISTSVHALGLELANLPEIVVSPPTSLPQHRLTICIPPLRLNYAYPDPMRMHTGDGSVSPVVPGAPRLKPRQLPDEDDTVAFDGRFENQRPLSSAGSSLSELMTPDDDVDVDIYSGLRIVIPSRNMKRKIQDVDSEDSDYSETSYPSRLQERVVKRRWTRSNTHAHAHRGSVSLSMRA